MNAVANCGEHLRRIGRPSARLFARPGAGVRLGLAHAAAVVALTMPVQGHAQGPARDVVARVLTTERRFLVKWREAWEASEAERHPLASPPRGGFGGTESRSLSAHCHHDPYGYAGPPHDGGALIRSRFSRGAVCPTWLLSGDISMDERLGIDAAISDARRPAIIAARDSLIALLDSAAESLPANGLIAGQRVRFLVDQMRYDRALAAAVSCRAHVAWCASLAGYALAARGELRSADSAFNVARATMSAVERCEWADLGILLDVGGRSGLVVNDCARRDTLAHRVWWLADPLYTVSGNERLVEHHVRRVMIALKSATGRSERYEWEPELGGDALRDMVLRYGWPSYVYWPGRDFDEWHAVGHLAPWGSPENPPFTTYEYSFGRVSLMPAWRAVEEPFDSRNADWQLQVPVGADPMPEARGPLWPAEHFMPPYPLVQLPDGQTALLRRTDSVLLAFATDLEPQTLRRQRTDNVRGAALVSSTGPDSVTFIARADGIVGGTLVARGEIASRPMLIGLEVPPDSQPLRPAARARFGIKPPPTLAALAPGERAISDPVILTVPGGDAPVPTATDAALDHMAGSTRVRPIGRIGVFWETYGFLPTDTVRVAVVLERHSRESVARRLGQWLRLVPDRNTPVAVGWEEPQPAARVHVIAGPVPIIGRSVALDVSNLPPGEYWIDVQVGKPGQEPVRGRRSITIVANDGD